MSAFSFDLEPIALGLVGVKRRPNASAHVLVDAQQTQNQERQGTSQRRLLDHLVREQVRVKVTNGRPLVEAYLHANVHGHLAGRVGHMHAKVLLTRTHMVVGSTNFSTGSQSNEEVAVDIRLTPHGATLAHQHFLRLWDEAQVYEGEARAAQTRGPGTRRRSRSAHP